MTASQVRRLRKLIAYHRELEAYALGKMLGIEKATLNRYGRKYALNAARAELRRVS